MLTLQDRILEISYKYNLSHLGSVLTAVDIIDHIFSIKKPDEKFILSSGHAGLALYVVLEKYGLGDAEEKFLHHGVHPDRCESCHLDCSAGSLGHGLPIAIGMALADRRKNVYCLVSDGECAEGSIWESLNIFEDLHLDNLFIYININGWGAYRQINSNNLVQMLLAHVPHMQNNIKIYITDVNQYPFLIGMDAHYHVLTKEEYESVIC
jgi:transketolase